MSQSSDLNGLPRHNQVSGDENNTWLNTAPTEGSASGPLPVGNSLIDVRPDAVRLFGSQALGEGMDFANGLRSGVGPLLGQAMGIGPTFREAEDFVVQLGQTQEALMRFSGDVGRGLMYLGRGADTIATTYIHGDTASAATVDQVSSAFDASTRPPEAAGPGPATGHTAPGSLPPPGKEKVIDVAPVDPHGEQSIRLGTGGATVTIAADGANDFERQSVQELNELNSTIQDDLLKHRGEPEYELAPGQFGSDPASSGQMA